MRRCLAGPAPLARPQRSAPAPRWPTLCKPAASRGQSRRPAGADEAAASGDAAEAPAAQPQPTLTDVMRSLGQLKEDLKQLPTKEELSTQLGDLWEVTAAAIPDGRQAIIWRAPEDLAAACGLPHDEAASSRLAAALTEEVCGGQPAAGGLPSGLLLPCVPICCSSAACPPSPVPIAARSLLCSLRQRTLLAACSSSVCRPRHQLGRQVRGFCVIMRQPARHLPTSLHIGQLPQTFEYVECPWTQQTPETVGDRGTACLTCPPYP